MRAPEIGNINLHIVKASATITLSSIVDVKSVWRYYKLQVSTLSKPNKPTKNPPEGWTTTEPSYTNGSTNNLYFCDLTVFSDDTFVYSDVSLSSSYEAAKAAYNKAIAADNKVDNMEIGGRNLARNTSNEWSEWVTPKYNSTNSTASSGSVIYFPTEINVGDDYYIQCEVEFDNVTASDGKISYFYLQGDVDGKWEAGKFNPWNYGINNVENGIVNFSVKKTSNVKPTPPEVYGNCGFRVDNWATGRYRWRRIKVEFGNKATDWSPAPEDLVLESKTYTDAQLNITSDSITSTVSKTYATKTEVTAAQNTANNAAIIANSKGVDYSQGKMLFIDPTFSSGLNSIGVYNNLNNGNVTIDRASKSSDNPFADASHELIISNIGKANPFCGGFCFNHASRKNAIFIYRIFAKIPVGYNIEWAANSFGDDSSVTWLTKQTGTGRFAEYVCKAVCGSAGTFSTIGYFYIIGDVGTASSPIKWYVAYATCFDMTNTGDIRIAKAGVDSLTTRMTSAETKIEQNSDAIVLRATKTEVTSAIDGISVGGTNLLTNTGDGFKPTGGWSQSSSTWVPEGYYEYWYYEIPKTDPYYETKVGDVVTISFDAEVYDPEGLNSGWLRLYDNNMHASVSIGLDNITFPPNSIPKSTLVKVRGSSTRTLFSRQNTGDIRGIEFYSGYGSGKYFKISRLKIERGNKATDWTPAPEDLVSESKTYTDTELTQTSEEIRFDFNKSITSSSSELQSRIDDNDIATNQKLSEINKYIRFVDGKIILGETGNELMLTIQNNRVSFTQSGVEVAFFSDNKLHINKAEVLTSMKIGNYELAPRTDGGLALRKWRQ